MRVLHLFSGGVDSTIGLALLRLMGYEVPYCLFFSYGQKAVLQEEKAFREVPKHFGALPIRVHLPAFPDPATAPNLEFQESAIEYFMRTDSLTRGEAEERLNVWVFNRNAVFAHIGASWAWHLGCDVVSIGLTAEDTLPDNTQPFVDSVNETLRISLPNQRVLLIAPLIDMTKRDILLWGLDHDQQLEEHGIAPIPWDLIWTCYSERSASGALCGECRHCQILKGILPEMPDAIRSLYKFEK